MIKKCNRFVIAFYLFVCYNIFIPIFYSHLKGVFIKRIAKIGLSLFLALSILVNGVVFADEGIIPLDVNYNGVFFTVMLIRLLSKKQIPGVESQVRLWRLRELKIIAETI